MREADERELLVKGQAVQGADLEQAGDFEQVF